MLKMMIPPGLQNPVVALPTDGANDEVVPSAMPKVMDLDFGKGDA